MLGPKHFVLYKFAFIIENGNPLGRTNPNCRKASLEKINISVSIICIFLMIYQLMYLATKSQKK